jgi:hypothetical protein
MHSSSPESIIHANRREAEGRILDRICPIYANNTRRQRQLIGSSVLLRVASRSFLLTAAHVLDKNRDSTLYVAGGADFVALAGPSSLAGSTTANRDKDRLDFGLVDISDTPSDQWSRFRFLTPDDLDIDVHPDGGYSVCIRGVPRDEKQSAFGLELSIEPRGGNPNTNPLAAISSSRFEVGCSLRRQLQLAPPRF